MSEISAEMEEELQGTTIKQGFGRKVSAKEVSCRNSI